MRIALPIWDDRISPVFDVSTVLLLCDVEDGAIISQVWRSLEGSQPLGRVQTLLDWGVDVLICGAVSMVLEHLLQTGGVRVIPRVRGGVAAVLDAFVEQRLGEPQFVLPGCRPESRRRGGTRRSSARRHHKEAVR